jgi:hypothetical protein
MAARIEDDFMCAEQDGRVIASAWYSSHAAAMVRTERLAAGYGDDDPFHRDHHDPGGDGRGRR